jgi:hypothetical protein
MTMDFMNLLKNQLHDTGVLDELGRSIGADSTQVSKLAQLGVPAILEGLTRNAQTREGADALAVALDQHRDDAVGDLRGFFQQVDTTDGAKILDHVFAERNPRVQGNLAVKTGLDAGQVSNVLGKLAPLVLGALGNHKKEQNLDADGISGLLPSLGGLFGQGGGSGIASLLDADKNGDVLDDIQGMLGKLL